MAWYRLTSAASDPPSGLVTAVGSSQPLLDAQLPQAERVGALLAERRDACEDFLGPRTRQFRHAPPSGSTLYWVIASAAAKDPEGWASVERVLREDAEYARASDALTELREERASVTARLAAAGDGRMASWPAGYVIRQEDGGTSWGSLVSPSTGVDVVTEKFEHVLTSAGLAAGWTTTPAALLDRRGLPIQTHRLLVVTGRGFPRGFKGLSRGESGTGAGSVPHLVRQVAEGDAGAGGAWLYGSSAVRDALTVGGIRDIDFEVVRGGMTVFEQVHDE